MVNFASQSSLDYPKRSRNFCLDVFSEMNIWYLDVVITDLNYKSWNYLKVVSYIITLLSKPFLLAGIFYLLAFPIFSWVCSLSIIISSLICSLGYYWSSSYCFFLFFSYISLLYMLLKVLNSKQSKKLE